MNVPSTPVQAGDVLPHLKPGKALMYIPKAILIFCPAVPLNPGIPGKFKDILELLLVLNLLVTSPPTPRTQTPPLGWSGLGSLGAETKALPC